MIDQLIEILGRETANFESFLELLEHQQRALIQNDVNDLKMITERQREKLAESHLFSKQRDEVIDQIKRDNAFEGDLTVTRLIETVDQGRADQLICLRDAVLSLNERILKTRNQNASLLNASREYIQKMMTMLSKIDHPSAGYASSGNDAGGQLSVAIDRRI